MGPLFRSIRVFSSASVLSSPGKTPYPLPQNFSPFCPSLLPPCPKVAYFLDADNMKPTTALELSRLLDPFRSRLKVAMAFGNIQTFQKDKYRELMKADDAFHIVETPVTNGTFHTPVTKLFFTTARPSMKNVSSLKSVMNLQNIKLQF